VIVIESASHLSHRDESAIFVTELLLFIDGHVFRHGTARLLWLVNIVTIFIMEVTATWHRACWQLMWLGATLAADVFCSHASCWHGMVPRWMLTWIHAYGQRRVAIWLVNASLSDWPTCQDLVDPRVTVSLVHVSRYYWFMWQDLIGPRVGIWLVHVSGSYWATCRDLIGPCFRILLVHVSGSDWFTCPNNIVPCVATLLGHVSRSGWSMC
jgi:hypothetical protein